MILNHSWSLSEASEAKHSAGGPAAVLALARRQPQFPQHAHLRVDHDVMLQPKQVSELADQVVLVVRQSSVRVGHPPHRLHDLDAINSTPELRESFQTAIAAVTPAVFANRIREVIQVDVSEELERCPVPILDLRASRDMVVPKHNAKEVIALLPQISQVTFKAPHMLLQTRPEEATTAIIRFVEQLASR